MLFFTVEEFVAKLKSGLLEAAQQDVDPEACILDAENEAAGYFSAGFDLITVPGMAAVVHRLALWNLVSRMGIAEEHEVQLALYKKLYDSALVDLKRMAEEQQPAVNTANSPRAKRTVPKLETW